MITSSSVAKRAVRNIALTAGGFTAATFVFASLGHAGAAPATPASQLARLEHLCTHQQEFSLGLTVEGRPADRTFVCAEQQPAAQCREASLYPTCFATFGISHEAMFDLYGNTSTVGGRD